MPKDYDLTKTSDVRRMNKDIKKVGKELGTSFNKGLKSGIKSSGIQSPLVQNNISDCENVAVGGGDAINIKEDNRKSSNFWWAVGASVVAGLIVTATITLIALG